jgi:hypothetical protein
LASTGDDRSGLPRLTLIEGGGRKRKKCYEVVIDDEAQLSCACGFETDDEEVMKMHWTASPQCIAGLLDGIALVGDPVDIRVIEVVR